ncbi:MAG: aquaporin, partial [Caldisericum sp.]
LASGDIKNNAVGANLGGFFVALTVLGIGLSLGGPSGYAINPARDLGPRIFGAIAGTKGLFDGSYWFVAPILGPLIGAVLGVLTYDWFVTPFLAKKEG